ncbi:hypothetical protein [Ferruginibacter sp. HRS2-29]|uniref:hypothetical protein n=1 Tax=Ferruginibacter sp. HRS2-29 TaxID=2487334 RepID=UPI0020CE3808|nr:hypothetical protein [Ferruginibacter sp. HRS2-29]MCP9750045.1 hypothetical protein [Ferruginibacter sp. HRS2-29]
MKTLPFSILIIIGLILIINSSCTSSKYVYFYLENIGNDFEKVEMKVFIDDSLYIDKNVRTSSVSPSYSQFRFGLKKGIHVVKVLVDSLEKSDTLSLDKVTYYYITHESKNDSGLAKNIIRKIYLQKTTSNLSHR